MLIFLFNQRTFSVAFYSNNFSFQILTKETYAKQLFLCFNKLAAVFCFNVFLKKERLKV